MQVPVSPLALLTNTDLLCASSLRELPLCVCCVCAVVCFLSDRDWLRERVIQWIQAEMDSDSVETSNMTAVNDLLNAYFEVAPVVLRSSCKCQKHSVKGVYLTESQNPLETRKENKDQNSGTIVGR